MKKPVKTTAAVKGTESAAYSGKTARAKAKTAGTKNIPAAKTVAALYTRSRFLLASMVRLRIVFICIISVFSGKINGMRFFNAESLEYFQIK